MTTEPGRIRRLRVAIQGAVQGVGFRPHVYRLASEMALPGWVINDTQGVLLEVEGTQAALEHFLTRLMAEKPPQAVIFGLQHDWLAPAGFHQFEIRQSDGKGIKSALVLPDLATCPACLSELLNPADRRYRYPFTNCTNCGPRFTIIRSLPYDRPDTTMRRFTMCPVCQAEYTDPLDRRFHAQPNACSQCGPHLELWLPPLSGTNPQASAMRDAALQLAAAHLRAGSIVAVKGLGGFHLLVDARNAAAVNRLRRRKFRAAKPLAVMVRDLEQARNLCRLTAAAEALLTSPAAPIVLLPRQEAASTAATVAPDNPYLGLILPYTPLHHLLLREVDFPLVATSGNRSDEPICIDEQEAIQRLEGIADCFLVHNRPIERHVDDSVVWIVRGEARLLRRARGYAPLPLMLPTPAPAILAVGAHLKNNVALSVRRQVFVSQHIGNLDTAGALAAFERVIADFLQLYAVTPVAIAHDLHPEYLSTKWAQEKSGRIAGPAGATLIPVQHHHAHLAACLADNGVSGPALGVIWDGTGYGPDGVIWGGEFLVGDAASYRRVAHLRPFRLPGGNAAVREPRRSALALLWAIYGEAALAMDDLAPVCALQYKERRLLGQMLARGLNSPLTTSAGRLFDGIAALLDLHQQVTFEGQAAMALEFAANPSVHDAYPFALLPTTEAQLATSQPAMAQPQPTLVVDWEPMVAAVLADLRRAIPTGTIAARFQNTLVSVMVTVAERTGVPRVAFSGGCFQNRLLTEQAVARLEAAGLEVLLHRHVPPNDGCISLGQVAVAAAQLARSPD